MQAGFLPIDSFLIFCTMLIIMNIIKVLTQSAPLRTKRRLSVLAGFFALISLLLLLSGPAPVFSQSDPDEEEDSELSSVEIFPPTSVPPSIGWLANNDTKSSANVSIAKEQIDGEEWDVLVVNANLKANNGWAGAVLTDADIIQKLQNAGGVRFKVLGDGKKWRINLPTNNIPDGSFYGMTISTQNKKVSSVDVSYALLKQPNGAKKVIFSKYKINGIRIERANDTGTGASVIKVFDFEIF